MGTDNNHPNIHQPLFPSHKPPPLLKPAEPPAPTATIIPQQPPRNTTDSDFISIPSYSRWFSWENIHQCELRFLPEFFDGRSASKNPKTYKYYRNSIIQRFRDNPSFSSTKKITFTEVRKTIVGDVGSIRRVFDFLEAWGLINYSPPPSSNKPAAPAAPPPAPQPPLKLDDNNKDSSSKSADAAPPSSSVDTATAAAAPSTKKRLCSVCKSPCTISCFASDKHNLTLCGRCYLSFDYKVGITREDFTRVEIIDVTAKTDWTDKDTLLLLEAIMHYGDDWKKVSEHVGSGRSDKDCVTRFLKLPFGEQFVGKPESSAMDGLRSSKESSFPNKRMRLSPLADASNPILAQAAFLSALAGVEVAEVAAHAAVTALSDYAGGKIKEACMNPVSADAKKQDFEVAPPGDSKYTMESAIGEAQSQLEKEEGDVERAVSEIAVQAKELQDKIVHFEELDIQVERESRLLQQLKDLLYVDQLTLLFHKAAAQRTVESSNSVESIKAE